MRVGRTVTVAARLALASSMLIGAVACAVGISWAELSGHTASVALTTRAGAPFVATRQYGVGTVVVAKFDGEVPDRAAAERRLLVRTDPAVEGAWSWADGRTAQWRPREYFPAGTKVVVSARIADAALGPGLVGGRDESTSFVVGPRRISMVDDADKQVRVYENGELVRTMPTSTGRGGSETYDGKTITFWTQPGTYTVLDKENPVLMDSSTFGLPVDSPQGYEVSVPYATRISTDGIYLHQRNETVWAQGNTNTSAGCLNLNADNARRFFDVSNPGDVVEVRNTGGKPLARWQNGDWSVPWEQWVAGSALAPESP